TVTTATVIGGVACPPIVRCLARLFAASRKSFGVTIISCAPLWQIPLRNVIEPVEAMDGVLRVEELNAMNCLNPLPSPFTPILIEEPDELAIFTGFQGLLT